VTQISAHVVLSSVGRQSPRLTTMLLRYPLIIHAELMTHRVFSRNAASSRAIPIKRMINDVLTDPFVPLVWQKNVPGMQGGEELDPVTIEAAKLEWLHGLQLAVRQVRALDALGVHKQIANRLLGPYAHITVLVTSNYWRNWFKLRDHPKAEPHIRILAQKMQVAMDTCETQVLVPGQWHLPFANKDSSGTPWKSFDEVAMLEPIRVSVARCASTSYRTVDDRDMDEDTANKIYKSLLGDDPLHASPAEHQARMDKYTHHGWDYAHQRGNLAPGWRQYRKMLSNEADMEDYL
jgi:hypothetical protein